MEMVGPLILVARTAADVAISGGDPLLPADPVLAESVEAAGLMRLVRLGAGDTIEAPICPGGGEGRLDPLPHLVGVVAGLDGDCKCAPDFDGGRLRDRLGDENGLRPDSL